MEALDKIKRSLGLLPSVEDLKSQEKIRIMLVGSRFQGLKINHNETIDFRSENISPDRYNALFDYDMIIFHPVFFNTWNGVDSLLALHREELSKFFLNGGYAIFRTTPKTTFGWLPFKTPAVEYKSGDQVAFNQRHWLYPFIKSVEDFATFRWKVQMIASLNQLNEESQKSVIATNKINNPVSWELKFGKGSTIFLPYFEVSGTNELLFWRNLIDSIERHGGFIKGTKDVPQWVNSPEFKFESEIKLEETIQKLSTESELDEKARSLLWQDSYDLTNAVTHILNYLGLTAINKEQEGGTDIEIDEKDVIVTTEVKGRIEYADVKDLRGLLQWYVDKKNEENSRDIKGLFILNHFKNEPPEKRKDLCKSKLSRSYPFTDKAEELAKNNGFCLMTTYQLFSIFKSFRKHSIRKALILKLILDTRGILTDEELNKVLK